VGWGSGTRIFDKVLDNILKVDEVDKYKVVEDLLDILTDGDWDTIDESEYYNHPLVQKACKKLNLLWEEN